MAKRKPSNDDLNRNLQKEKIENALHMKNAMKTFNLNKENIKAKVDNLLSYSMNGGTFEVSPELIGFVNFIVSSGREEVIILDKNRLPIIINNTKEFLDKISDVYFFAVNEYYLEYEQLRSSRRIDVALEL